MFNLDEEILECPTCFEVLKDGQIMIFNECQHIFCTSCALKIMLEGYAICPMDRRENHYVINGHDNRNIVSVPTSIHDIWLSDRQMIMNIFEDQWSILFLQLSKTIKLIKFMLENHRDRLSQWLSMTGKVGVPELLKENSHFRMLNENIKELLETIPWNTTKEITLSGIFNMFKVDGQCPFVFNLKNAIEFNREFFDVTLSRPNFLCLKDSGISSSVFIAENLDFVEEDLDGLIEISFYITKLILSFLGNNRVEYLSHCTEMNELQISKCLICAEEISKSTFAQFSECNHKICMICINKFIITHASCPFDGCEISELVIYNENETNSEEPVLEVLFRISFPGISDILEELAKFNVTLIYRIWNIFQTKSNIVKVSRRLQMALETRNIVVVRDTLDILRRTFERIENKMCGRTFEISALKYRFYMNCFFQIKSIVDGKAGSGGSEFQLIRFFWKFHSSIRNNRLSCTDFLDQFYAFQDQFWNSRDLNDIDKLSYTTGRFLDSYETLSDHVHETTVSSSTNNALVVYEEKKKILEKYF